MSTDEPTPRRIEVSKEARSRALREALNSKAVRVTPMTPSQQKAFDALANLRSAMRMVEETGIPVSHQHLVSPTGRRCIDCGVEVERPDL